MSINIMQLFILNIFYDLFIINDLILLLLNLLFTYLLITHL